MAPSPPARADWSALPSAALVLVSRRLITHGDYFRFRAVCAFWRSAVPVRATHLSPQIPWLALPFPEDPDASEACRFFRLSDQRIHSVDLPWARGNHCFGASSGWLAFLGTAIDLFLINPVSTQMIPLPPLRSTAIPSVPEMTDFGYVIHRPPSDPDYAWDFDRIHCEHFVNMLVLSSDDPISPDCVAMAIFNLGATCAVCKPVGGDSWTVVRDPIRRIEDVIFYRGRFYAVDDRMALYICDLGIPAMIRVFSNPGEEEPGHYNPYAKERCLLQERRRRGDVIERIYLVESRGGDLLMVLRTYDDIFHPLFDDDLGHLMLDFEVYRWDARGGGERPRWVELESLGDEALFLGPGCSLSISAGDLPPSVCRRNCIYFGDYRPGRHTYVEYGGADFGVFDYGDGHVDRAPCCEAHVSTIWRPSIWLTPTLHTSSCLPW